MTVIAFILIKTSLGKVDECLNSIKKISGVKEAYSVTGIYDIIVKVEVDDVKMLKDVVVNGIHRIEGIESTMTLIAV